METRKLSQIGAGKTVTVIGLRGGAKFNGKLTSMGISLGFDIQVIEPEPSGGGAMLIGVGGTRLMLGHGMAEKIIVRQS
jgi:Fe2+ transport system protein FeoA